MPEYWSIKIPNAVHRQLRHLPEVKAHISALAKEGAKIAGEGFEAIDRHESKQRPRSYIAPADDAAVLKDATESSLLKAISAMRGH